jgi:hypothetical protein
VTRKEQILSYLFSNPHPICDDCLAEITHCSTRQDANRICRDLNDKNQISRNTGYCNKCQRNKTINQIRSENPVINQNPPQKKDSQLLPSSPPEKDSQLIISSIHHSWEPVLASSNSRYLFPGNITSNMKSVYRFPAIYRWLIQFPSKSVIYYIGETEQLCPGRINLYLKPDHTTDEWKIAQSIFWISKRGMSDSNW